MTKIKICGLKRPADAELAVELGAWALGMILWRKSPRYCTPEEALEISTTYRRKAEIAGVFVDAKLDEVVETAQTLGLSIVQLHGSEGPQFCEEVARRTGCKVVKAFRVQNRSVLGELRHFRDVDFHLLDTYKAGVPGGTGETFDWSFLAEREGRVPLILSGGLTPENVAEAITTVQPYAVDVSSGVESEPGVKDHDKLRAFFEAAATVAVLDDQSEPITGAEEEVLTLAFAQKEAADKRALEMNKAAMALRLAEIREREAAAAEAAASDDEPEQVVDEVPDETPTEQPSPDPVADPIEDPAEEPLELPDEPPLEEPTEAPVEAPTEPLESPVETPQA